MLSLRHAFVAAWLLTGSTFGFAPPQPHTRLNTALEAHSSLAKTMAGIMTAGLLLLSSPSIAAESRIIGELKGSGLVFKDTLTIESFDDPKVSEGTLEKTGCLILDNIEDMHAPSFDSVLLVHIPGQGCDAVH
jgi:hypothetical protein